MLLYQQYFEAHRKFYKRAGEVERERWGQKLPMQTLQQMATLTLKTMFVKYAQGALEELEGTDPIPVLENGPTSGRLTSILVVTHDAIDQTQRCLEALRATSESAHPVELIFVDNGSSDGTAAFLSEQNDVRLIANSENLGAPHARNQALRVASGEQIVFMDNDVMVTPGWLGRLLFHLEVDGRSGCVGCLSDRAGHEQQIEYAPASSDPATLAHFSEQISAQFNRKFRSQGLMTSFLLMVRREVVDAIGGFDERFSPWGFEDDDFSLRSHLAGFRNRVALDVFVRHESYSGTVKEAKHGNLLDRNWKRFASKWQLSMQAAYGDCTGLQDLDHGGWAHADLHQPFDTPGAARSITERSEATPLETI